jgi:hypothetical protein
MTVDCTAWPVTVNPEALSLTPHLQTTEDGEKVVEGHDVTVDGHEA